MILTLIPKHLPKRREILCTHKDLYTNVYSTFICNRQILKTPQMVINRSFINKLGYIHMGIILNIWKEWKKLMQETRWLNLKMIMLSERSWTKDKQKGILFDSIHMKYYQMQTESRLMVVWGEGMGEGRQKLEGWWKCSLSSLWRWSQGNMFTYMKIIVHFKYIQFVICQLNINKCANKRKYLLSSKEWYSFFFFSKVGARLWATKWKDFL